MQAARVWGSLLRNVVTKTTRRNYGGGNLKMTTLNDMPVPEGCFKMHDAQRQRGHNMVLAIGGASLGFALFLCKATDTPKFHYNPPTTYE